jgi:glycosyltransferase involved in cell wall biosynthesis
MRAALKGWCEAPRFFQVPGPLHLEHWFFRNAEIASAGPDDYWIASSRCTRNLYLQAGIPSQRLFLSYYGLEMPETWCPAGLRSHLGIPADAFVAGNLNMFYGPKRYLGQRRGVKAHEDVIEALRIVISSRPNVYGVLLGGPWDNADTYFESLRRRAATAAPGRILLPGPIPPKDAVNVWREFDCAVHVPLSENCGGVVEPLLAGVPVVAGRVGGLPEVIIDDVTGRLVPIVDPVKLAEAILALAAAGSRPRMMAACGSQLVAEMFSPKRTGSEIKHIYELVLGHRTARPAEFDSTAYVHALAESA